MQPKIIARCGAFAALLGSALASPLSAPASVIVVEAEWKSSSPPAAFILLPQSESPQSDEHRRTVLRGWSESPAHVLTFAPPEHRAQYQAFVTSQPLERVLAGLTDTSGVEAPLAWAAESLPPVDAFGTSGIYDRFALARLYTQQAPRVARGPWRSSTGLETWTLVSPYPDAGLARLEPGTLLLVMRVPPL